MVFFKTLPFASRPAPFLFSFSHFFDGRKQQIGEGDEPRTRRLHRQVNWGWIKTKQLEALGAFEPLITGKLFQQVQDVFGGKRGARPTKHNRINAEFPLRGFQHHMNAYFPLANPAVSGRSPLAHSRKPA
jgi:hypothetical protein